MSPTASMAVACRVASFSLAAAEGRHRALGGRSDLPQRAGGHGAEPCLLLRGEEQLDVGNQGAHDVATRTDEREDGHPDARRAGAEQGASGRQAFHGEGRQQRRRALAAYEISSGQGTQEGLDIALPLAGDDHEQRARAGRPSTVLGRCLDRKARRRVDGGRPKLLEEVQGGAAVAARSEEAPQGFGKNAAPLARTARTLQRPLELVAPRARERLADDPERALVVPGLQTQPRHGSGAADPQVAVLQGGARQVLGWGQTRRVASERAQRDGARDGILGGEACAKHVVTALRRWGEAAHARTWGDASCCKAVSCSA